MKVRPRNPVTMRMRGQAVTHSRTDIAVRDLQSVIDEPLERGGTTQGPSPTETFGATPVGCTNVISHKIAPKLGFDLQRMTVGAEAAFDRRGATLAEDVAGPFPATTLTINVATDASRAQLDRLERELAMYCPIAKVVRGSGTVLHEVWNVQPI